MTTKKILITGLGAAATEESIRPWLGRFGSVERVDIIRDGDDNRPVALVEMDIGDGAAAYLVLRLSDYALGGDRANALLVNH